MGFKVMDLPELSLIYLTKRLGELSSLFPVLSWYIYLKAHLHIYKMLFDSPRVLYKTKSLKNYLKSINIYLQITLDTP